MKKNLNVFAFAIILLIVQSCGSKPDKTNEAASTPAVSVAAAKMTPAEKRAKIEKQRAAQAEKRRIAYEVWVVKYPTYMDLDGNIVFSRAEVAPEFVGGQDAMEKFLNEHINYPQEAKDNGDEGTVFVDFIVGKDGVVRNVEATDESGDNMDQELRDEAVRLVYSMPNWTPGRQHGKAVPARFSVPITFQLN